MNQMHSNLKAEAIALSQKMDHLDSQITAVGAKKGETPASEGIAVEMAMIYALVGLVLGAIGTVLAVSWLTQ